jgi:coenzyme F420 hydrogenase subunit beta
MDSENVEEPFTAKTEKLVFGRQRRTDEPFGAYRRIALAQTTNPEIARICQDGGVVTTLFSFALEKNLIDAALVTGTNPQQPFYPIPRIATNSQEILGAAGSKYVCSLSPLTLASDAKKQGKTRVAFVGTPCQVQALRRLQMVDPEKYGFVEFSVGLMCSGCFNYELISEFVQEKLGINPHSIVKMNIKQKLLITTESGVTTIPLSEAKQYKRRSCEVCRDFSSELADISVGGLGLDGWTFTVVRSEKGKELFWNAEKAGLLRTKSVEAEDISLKLLVKLSQKKGKNL